MKIFSFPPTIILRHRRENVKKCSLRGLEERSDMQFFTYPQDALPEMQGYFLLTLEGDALTEKDKDLGIFLLDGTWRYAEKMAKSVPQGLVKRRIPEGYVTAYPRRQEDCVDPSKGLASVEALFIAYSILGRDSSGLLDHYHWKQEFLGSALGNL